MKFYSIIKTRELAALLIESKPWRGIVDMRTGIATSTKSLNLLMKEDGSLVALGDDDIELVKEVEDE